MRPSLVAISRGSGIWRALNRFIGTSPQRVWISVQPHEISRLAPISSTQNQAQPAEIGPREAPPSLVYTYTVGSRKMHSPVVTLGGCIKAHAALWPRGFVLRHQPCHWCSVSSTSTGTSTARAWLTWAARYLHKTFATFILPEFVLLSSPANFAAR